MVHSLFHFPGFFLKLILTQVSLSRSLRLKMCPEIMRAYDRMLIPKCPEIGIGQWESQGRVWSTVKIIYLRKKEKNNLTRIQCVVIIPWGFLDDTISSNQSPCWVMTSFLLISFMCHCKYLCVHVAFWLLDGQVI